MKLLGSLVLIEHGRSAAWAHRLCVEQPTTENKQGKVTVRYPRGAQAEKEHHAQALAALKRARTPEAALAVVLRLLVAQRLADTAGLPGADRQGVYEPQELAGSAVLGKLAAAGRAAIGQAATWPSRRPSASSASRRGGSEQAARLEEQRAKLAAGETSAATAAAARSRAKPKPPRRTARLVHVGDCEQQWGSATTLDDGGGGRLSAAEPSTVRPIY